MVEKQYLQDVAKHVAAPEDSLFRIMSHTEYKSLGPSELANVLEKKHLVIKDIPMADMEFNELGLSTLSPLHAKVALLRPF